jgi:tetratricopeptide (TPR) repeat protein
MATVYLADDLKHHRQVAIKVLRPELAASLGVDRFLREIEITANLSHPHILPLHDSGQVDGLAYFVMPYIEGESLRQRLERELQLPVEVALRIAREVADGLEYAHQHDCIHRDVKPENILLTESHALIADFGVARALTASVGEPLTSSGIALGTPAYFSPEQAGSDVRIDGRADVYALGCVVFEMLAGEPPFTGPTAQAIIAKHVLEPVPALGVVRPGISPSVVSAVEKALAKAAADRHPSAAAFAQTLSAAEAELHTPVATTGATRGTGRWRPTRRTSVSLTVFAALAIALIVFGWRFLSPGSLYAVEDARQKFIVLPHQAGRMTPEEEDLVQRAEDELTRLLIGWAEARAVPTVAKAGLAFDLGLSGPIRATLSESIALAREARVGTLVTLTVRIVRDTAFLQSELFHVATGNQLGDPIATDAPAADVYALVAPAATRILDFSGAPEQLLSARRESNNLAATSQVQAGRQDLERGRLLSAERLFRAALAEDSTFARAHYLLGLTLYWQAARHPQRFPELGGEIRRHASAARRHGAALVYRDSLFVEALFSFQNGDYPAARELYHELVRTDSTDAYAWLLLGSVEFQDPWTVAGPDGALRPRGNINVARRAFTRAVQLSPDFFLGYGHLFDIYTRLSGAIVGGVCYGYEPPSDRVVLIWETRDPKVQVTACPAVRDSIEWVDRPTLSSMDEQQLIDRADRFLDEALIELRRWSNYAPADPRPSEELTAWLMARRELLPRTTSVTEMDSLASEALGHAETAMALKPDTTPEDLTRLGMLYLNAGDVPRALDITERAVERSRSGAGADTRLLPTSAANVFLATGQASRALEIVLPIWSTREMTVPDTAEDRHVDVLAEAEIGRLQVYGATGLGGAPLRDAFSEVERIWTGAGYDARVRAIMRQGLTGWILPALFIDQVEMAAWFSGWDPANPTLAGILAVSSDSATAGRLFESSLRELGEERPSPLRAYLLGVLAQSMGQHQRAIELFDHIDTWPLRLGTMDMGWGLLSLSRLLRAQSYEALGNMAEARLQYERFVELWETADPELQRFATEAGDALSRLP